MAKFDYSKIESELQKTLHEMRSKDLKEGKTIMSKRTEEYYGLDEETPRPVPQEPVEKLLREEAAKEEIAQKKLHEKKDSPSQEEISQQEKQPLPPVVAKKKEEEADVEEENPDEVVWKTPVFDVLKKARLQSDRLPKITVPPLPDVPSSDRFFEPASHLYILRQHILWLKYRHYDNRYELLGTTKEEVMTFRQAKRLSEDQISRIKEINARAEEVKAGILAEQGVHTDEKQIEQQKEKHKTKRFNIKDTWLQL
jgi:hypothetical protein